MSVFSPLDEGYIELEDTYICKDYGFASVMRWLGTWHASQNSATDKCNTFPDFCVGITQSGAKSDRPMPIPTDFYLREVSQLVSGVTARGPQGCEPKADNPKVFHKQITGEQKRLHVLKNHFKLQKTQKFNLSIKYNDINGPKKGLYYRHAIVWEGRAVKGVQHIELISPGQNTSFSEKEKNSELEVAISTPFPGWYTVLSKITDCIGQPMFELRWAFRIQSQDKEEDDKKILSADISQFEGDSWGYGISMNVFKKNLEKYFNVAESG